MRNVVGSCIAAGPECQWSSSLLLAPEVMCGAGGHREGQHYVKRGPTRLAHRPIPSFPFILLPLDAVFPTLLDIPADVVSFPSIEPYVYQPHQLGVVRRSLRRKASFLPVVSGASTLMCGTVGRVTLDLGGPCRACHCPGCLYLTE